MVWPDRQLSLSKGRMWSPGNQGYHGATQDWTTSRKSCHRDICIVLDAANVCLMSDSNHHFVPGLLEVVNDATVVQEIIGQSLGEFAGKTFVLLYCCSNFTPKPLSMY